MDAACGKRPLPLWTYGRDATGEPVAPRPLAGDWRDEFALVYEAAAQRGMRPKDCDEMEIWELAAALGANHPDDDDPLADASGLSWNERRAYALERGLPEPQWEDEPLTAQEKAQMERLMLAAPPMLPPDE